MEMMRNFRSNSELDQAARINHTAVYDDDLNEFQLRKFKLIGDMNSLMTRKRN
jgi:hypothetical protein